jgi:hypothetical protein
MIGDTMVMESAVAEKKGWSFKVQITAERGPPPDYVTFSMKSRLLQGTELVFDKFENGMKKRDYYIVEFDLDDDSGLDLSFHPDPRIAFWVNLDRSIDPECTDVPSCPTDASYSDEIFAICVGEDELKVRNEDKTKAKFSFSLGFVKGGFDPDNPAGQIRYDPVGSNKDGGI